MTDKPETNTNENSTTPASPVEHLVRLLEDNMEKIIYEEHPMDNTKEVYAFIGAENQYVCTLCGGYGEYEDDGPKGCNLCNSRLIPFIDKDGKLQTADWGDEIVKDGNGKLSLKRNHRYE